MNDDDVEFLDELREMYPDSKGTLVIKNERGSGVPYITLSKITKDTCTMKLRNMRNVDLGAALKVVRLLTPTLSSTGISKAVEQQLAKKDFKALAKHKNKRTRLYIIDGLTYKEFEEYVSYWTDPAKEISELDLRRITKGSGRIIIPHNIKTYIENNYLNFALMSLRGNNEVGEIMAKNALSIWEQFSNEERVTFLANWGDRIKPSTLILIWPIANRECKEQLCAMGKLPSSFIEENVDLRDVVLLEELSKNYNLKNEYEREKYKQLLEEEVRLQSKSF